MCINQTLKNRFMAGFKSKLVVQERLGRIIYCCKACIKSFMALAKTQAEIYISKIFGAYIHILNEYAKEKNKMVDWPTFHRVLLMKGSE